MAKTECGFTNLLPTCGSGEQENRLRKEKWWITGKQFVSLATVIKEGEKPDVLRWSAVLTSRSMLWAHLRLLRRALTVLRARPSGARGLFTMEAVSTL